jgi:hypothetical protein
MKQVNKKLSAWMILIGLFLQIGTPIFAAVQSSSSRSSEVVLEKPGFSIKRISEEVSELVDIANFNVQVLIEQIVTDAVEQGSEEKLSSALLRCYKSISEGETVINVDALVEAMPELLHYAVLQEKLRAIRPDAPIANANNAIVACGGDCDLTQLIRLLASIRARIGSVNDNPCCGTILGILGDACNVPCIGENGSISEVLCEILDSLTGCCSEIIETITECCAEIIETITECCAEIHEDFEDTWTILADIKDTITECCAEIKSEIFDTQTLIIDEFEQTWTILADIKDTITECCAEIKLEIFNTQTLIVEGFEGTWTMIDDCCACGPIPLFQSDVIGGVINLTTTGLNYCLAENITGNIAITGGNVTVDGNDRVLTGRIFIDAADVIVKNAKVKPTAPGNSTEAGFAGIHGTSASAKVQILNCLVECADTTVVTSPSVSGRIGIFSDADNVVVERCKVKAGRGGDSSDNLGGGLGGAGIKINGNSGSVKNSTAIAGDGGNTIVGGLLSNAGGNGIDFNGNSASINNSTAIGGNGGLGSISGGIGIRIIGNDWSLQNLTAVGGFCGAATSFNLGFPGGSGIEIDGSNGLIENMIASGGVGGTSGPVNGVSAGRGGHGIAIIGNNNLIKNSRITGGSGGIGGEIDSGASGNGGLGGSGIKITGSYGSIEGCEIHGGQAGTGGGVFIFPPGSPAPNTAGEGGIGGIGIEISGDRWLVNSSRVFGGLGGHGGSGQIVSGDAGNGGRAIQINGAFAVVDSCFTQAGDGGEAFDTAFGTGGSGGSGGDAIIITGLKSSIKNSIAHGGLGQRGATLLNVGTPLVSGSGGSGGSGIIILEGNDCLIVESEAVGNNGNRGGNGPAAAPIAVGSNDGNGGYGILIVGLLSTIEESVGIGGNAGELAGGNSFAGQQGGFGGDGIQVTGDTSSIRGSKGVGGNAGKGGFGTVGGIGGNGGFGGNGIKLTGTECTIENFIGVAGDGGVAGESGTAGVGGAGGQGAYIIGDHNVITGVSFKGGNGGFGAPSFDFVPQSGNGGIGGDGIQIDGSFVSVAQVTAAGGNGEQGGDGFTGHAGGDGGMGGNGIQIISDNNTVTIKSTSIVDGGVGGLAGNIGSGTSSGAPGAGGNGILVNENIQSVQMCDCTINGVGLTTAPGVGGDGIRVDSNDDTNCIQIINTSILSSGGNGINLNGPDNFQIRQCNVECNGTDGIAIGSSCTDGQVASNNANTNSGFGISNGSGNSTVFTGNVATNNTAGNYSGVTTLTPILVSDAAGAWSNVYYLNP